MSSVISILVVDDVRDNADMLVIMCEAYGFRAEAAYTGKLALEAALRIRPAVVLTDIGLPDMSGYDLAKALRADPALNQCILIAISGYGSSSDMTGSEASGFNAHLTKPIDMEDMIGRIQRLLADRALPFESSTAAGPKNLK